MNEPQLTVITPVYNGIRCIERCIQSVLDQNCPAAEHLIIDGRSSDGTLKIIQSYAERYPHIRWISEKDQGQSDAMNKGIRLAKGKTLGILNADDYYEKGVLREVTALFEHLPEPSIAFGGCYTRDENGGVLWTSPPPKGIGHLRLLTGYQYFPFPPNPSAYFYHKSLHAAAGEFDITQHYVMDFDFLIRACRHAHIRVLNKYWGNFSYTAGTKTFQDKNNSMARINERISYYRKRLRAVEKLRLFFLIRAAYLQKRFFPGVRSLPPHQAGPLPAILKQS